MYSVKLVKFSEVIRGNRSNINDLRKRIEWDVAT